MNRVIIVCEGQTEQVFCKALLGPHLATFGVAAVTPTLKHSNGGDVRWSKLEQQVKKHLLGDTTAHVTTFVDYYGRGRPAEWPAAAAAATEQSVRERVAVLEDGMSSALSGITTERFIPYLQLHEFEALLFSDPDTFAASTLDQDPKMAERIQSVVRACGEPELINNSAMTSPSHRLKAIAPGFNKVIFGALIAESIGLKKIRAACPGFSRWVLRLEALG